MDAVEDVDRVLADIGRDVRSNRYIRLADIPSLHFLSWTILARDPEFAPLLVLESSFDGPVDAHLDVLVERGAAALDAAYGRCPGYPAPVARTPATRKRFLRDHDVTPAIFFASLPGQTVAGIRNAVGVRQAADAFLDAERAAGRLDGQPAEEITGRLRRHLSANGVRPQRSKWTLDELHARSLRNALLLGLLALPLVNALLPLLILFMLAVRSHEIQEEGRAARTAPPSIDPRLYANDDVNVQNHLTTVVRIKPGRFRRWTLRAILWISNLLARTVFLNGRIGGIPTIHFVRWLVLDGGERLVFFSHYDGSWNSNLGDFSDQAAWTLTAIYGNTEDFPPSRWLIGGGASDIEAFKDWTRRHNVYTPVWYSAYPDATIRQLQREIPFRDAMVGVRQGDDEELVLQRL